MPLDKGSRNLLIALSLIIIMIVSLLLYTYFSYIKWEESFENSIPSDELITKENNDTKEL